MDWRCETSVRGRGRVISAAKVSNDDDLTKERAEEAGFQIPTRAALQGFVRDWG